MGIQLFDEDEFQIEEEQTDPEQAFHLLCRILQGKGREEQKDKQNRKIVSLLSSCVPEAERVIRFERDIELLGKLDALRDSISMKSHFDLMADYNVVGLCGRFSAGKSGFVNAILGENYLPEDTISTTAIPTYIAYGEREGIVAYLRNGNSCELTRELLQTMSHRFEEQYHIAFSLLIDSIVLRTPRMPYKNLMLLDTPGYSVDQSNAAEDASRAQLALQEADGVMCLFGVDSGDMTNDDLDFFHTLRPKHKPPLFVVTKRDLVSNEVTRSVCDQVRRTAQQAGIAPYGVTAFSVTLLEHEPDGATICRDYLSAMNRIRVKREPFSVQVDRILEDIRLQVESRIDMLIDIRKKNQLALMIYPDPIRAKGLVLYIAKLSHEITDLRSYKKHIDACKTQIKGLWSE